MTSRKDLHSEIQRHFDQLIAKMQRPGYANAIQDALFREPEELRKHYRPGATELTAHTPGGLKK